MLSEAQVKDCPGIREVGEVDLGECYQEVLSLDSLRVASQFVNTALAFGLESVSLSLKRIQRW